MRAFDRSLVRDVLNAPSERLGLFRAALGGYLAIYFVLRLPGAWHTMNSSVAVFEPAGLVDWVGVEKVPPVGVSAGIYLATLLLSVAFAFGAHFKWTGPLTALGVLWVTSAKSSFGMIFHTENLFAIQTLLVGFSPAARALSYDARRSPPSTGADIPPGWPLLFCALLTISVYLLAGLAKYKLAGLEWATGDVLRIQVAYDNVRKIELGGDHASLGVWAVRHGWLLPPLAALTLVAEFAGPLALLHRRLALAWVGLLVAFHWGVLAMMAIGFPFPMSGIPFLCLFRLEETRPGRWLTNRFAPRTTGAAPGPT